MRKFVKQVVAVFATVGIIGMAGAAEFSYETKKNIAYYSDSAQQSDSYLREQCVLDIYYPKGKKDFATVVWFHAGGLKVGRRYIPGALRNQGIAVVAVDYRLYPKAKAPDFLHDAAAAVAWVFKNIKSYGGSDKKVFVSGASAGAYLSMMIGLDRSYLAQYSIDANRIAGIGSLSAQVITHVAVREEMGGNRVKPVVDKYSPLHHVRKDAPPILLVTGDRDIELLGRYEENAYFWRMLQVVGHADNALHELKGMDHPKVEKPALPYLLKFVKRLALAN